MSMTNKEIAQTILNQIKATDPAALMAWGVRNCVALPEQKILIQGAEKVQLGGVQFNVNGLKFRGKVLVRLMGSDTYTVEIGRIYKGAWKVKEQREDVYCDELMAHIDGLIER